MQFILLSGSWLGKGWIIAFRKLDCNQQSSWLRICLTRNVIMDTTRLILNQEFHSAGNGSGMFGTPGLLCRAVFWHHFYMHWYVPDEPHNSGGGCHSNRWPENLARKHLYFKTDRTSWIMIIMLTLCPTFSIVWCMADIGLHNVSGVGCTSVFRWSVAIILTFVITSHFILLVTSLGWNMEPCEYYASTLTTRLLIKYMPSFGQCGSVQKSIRTVNQPS